MEIYFSKTNYFIKQNDYTEFIKHIIQVTNNLVQIKAKIKIFLIFILI